MSTQKCITEFLFEYCFEHNKDNNYLKTVREKLNIKKTESHNIASDHIAFVHIASVHLTLVMVRVGVTITCEHTK